MRPRPGSGSFSARHPEIAPGDLDESFYVHRDREAVQHFFRVAASLDSMVVGEPQILGQVKQAYREATEHQATGPILNRLLHKTFSVAKRVRSETGIGDHAVSVSYAAVSHGQEDLRGPGRQKRPVIGGRRDGRTGPGAPQGPGRRPDHRGQPHPGAGRGAWPGGSGARPSPWRNCRSSS